MRLAFWRKGSDRAVAQRALPKPASVAAELIAPSPSGDLDLHALGEFEPQAADHRSTILAFVVSPRRAQHGDTALQIRGAHSDRRARERVPAAERRAQRGACRTRPGGRHKPGAALAVARSGARDHQEEQAGRAARIRSGAAGVLAGKVAAGIVRYRPRPVLADAGRGAVLYYSIHGLRRGQSRHRRRIPVPRSPLPRASPI